MHEGAGSPSVWSALAGTPSGVPRLAGAPWEAFEGWAVRVAHFSDCYRPVINGVVTSIQLLKHALERQGHAVSLYAPAYPGQPRDGERGVHGFASCWQPFHSDNRAALFWPPSLLRQALREPADLVHLHTPFNLGLLGCHKAWRKRLPLVFTHHTLWEEYVHYLGVPEWVGRRITRSIYGFYFTRVDHIIAPSAQVRARLDRMGVKVPCTVIPTGIDAGFFQHGDAQKVRSELGLNGDEVVFCFIGRIGEEKSIDFVLSCFAEAAREKPELRLLVIGNGQALAGLRKLAAKLGVADQVLFTGSRPRAELRNYLAASRAFLFASETETQGLVLLEAAAAGVPVCAVRASGVSDAVVDGETGVLLHSGDRVAFVRTILDLAARPDWARRLGQHGASWVERFSTVEMARQVLEVYHQAIERNSVRRSQR